MRRVLLAVGVLALTALSACNVNEYCLNCATEDGGGGDDGGSPDAIRDGGGMPDACIPNGSEVCDGLDNDCDGDTDEDVPTVGDACGADVGVCTVGVIVCDPDDGLSCTGDALQGPEACDDLDNDCDTVVDDNNPEGGERCGTDLGDCVAGFTMCITGGVLDCVGDMGTPGGVAEACDGRDNDCDGNFDEGLPAGPACGATDTGECSFGVEMCVGGGTQCVGYIGPTFEACDTTLPLPLDSDCDGFDHNGYDLDHDVNNCGACGDSCVGTITNATAICDNMCVGGSNAGRGCNVAGDCPGGSCGGGDCVPGNCNPGFYDIAAGAPGSLDEGCEYACDFQGPQEDCNSEDDNCNGVEDEGLIPPPICINTPGTACAGTTAMCIATGPTSAWDCNYGPDVSTDGSGNIIPESECDGVDNDCDGRIDEGDPIVNTFTSCNDTAVGVCQKFGHMVCDPLDEDAAPICSLNLTVPIVDSGGTAPSATDTCDGLDNDCDGLIDDNTLTITNAACAAGVVTITAAAHTMVTGQSVTIRGVLPAGYNGTFAVASTPTANTFTYALTCPGAFVSGGTANGTNAASRSALQTWVPISGTAPNETFIMAYEASRPDAANPDTITRVITTITRATNVVTVTTGTAHGFTIGSTVIVAGVTDTTFNGNVVVTATPTTTTFRYAQTAANATSSGGTASKAVQAIGLQTTHACSRAGVQPWVIIDQPDAETACAAVGGRMCTEQEWHQACAGVTGNSYPIAEPAASSGRMYIEAEDYATLSTATSGGVLRAWVPDYSGNTTIGAYNGISAMRASPNTGANLSTGTAPTEGPRLNYTVTLSGTQGASNHSVWVRMYAPNGNDDRVFVGFTGSSTGLQQLTGSTTWTWLEATFNAPGNGTQTITIYMDEDGVKVDALVVTRDTAASAPTDTAGNGNDFPYSNTYNGATCNGEDFDGDVFPANGGDQDDGIATGSTSLPSCIAEWGAQDVFDMSGNAKEWTLERLPGSNPIRGGASNNEQAGLTCSNAFTLADDEFFFNNVGFRCCKGP